jgi:Stigma-specific protein, Stig1
VDGWRPGGGRLGLTVPGVAWANDRCPEGQHRCGDRCVILKTNERHCGSCRNRCGTKQTCCGGRCVNLKRSERHCGSCSNRCAAGEECDHGVCKGGTCPPERTLTEGDCHCAFVCGDPFPSPATCQDNPNCLCSETTEGTGFCAGPGAGGCPPECSFSSDCEPGSACIIDTCCGHPICAPPCTPTCAQNGSACSTSGDCCSGNCVNAPSGMCACKGLFSACNNNSECCSGTCNEFGSCDQNLVTCTCQDGFENPNLCTTTQACGDTTALNQFCNSFCLTGDHGSGVASKCSQGGCGT